MGNTHPPDLNLPSSVDLLNAFPLPMVVFDRSGLAVVYTPAAHRFWGIPPEQIVGNFNVLEDPQSVQNGSRETLARALAGEAFEREFDTLYRNAGGISGNDIWIRPIYVPLHDAAGEVAYVVVIYRDVTPIVTQQTEIATARESLAAQQQLIQELSSPVVRIWEGILLLPLVGIIDARRSSLITEHLLEALVRYQADIVIIDITGVPVVDTPTAQYFIMTAQAAGLLGSQVVLVGISSEIAQTMVHLGIDLSQIITRSDLQAGLAYAFALQGLTVARRNLDGPKVSTAR